MIDYDLEPHTVARFLKQHRAKRVGIQLPAGLRHFWPKIAHTVRKSGSTPLFLKTCYGACDLADLQAKQLGCDVLLHYGHADMGLPTLVPTLYVEARVKRITLEAIELFAKRVHGFRIGLFTTVQYVEHLPRIVGKLRELGLKPVIGKPGPRTKYRGQVLGCDFSCVKQISKKCEALLYVGTGRFHPLGCAIATRKPVYIANPLTGKLSQIGGLSEFLQSRKAAISKAASGRRFGVIVSTKRGQARYALALQLVEKLITNRRTAELVVLDEVLPEHLADYSFDALVCTACPRIPIDDSPRYEVPLLTPFELSVMLGERPLEDYQMDEIVRTDFGKI